MVTSVFWCQVRRHSAALRVALVLHSAARMDPFAEDGNEGMEQSPASPDADMLESEMLSWESTFENMPVMLPAHDETGMPEMSSPGASSSACSPSARTSSSASAAESFSPAAGMSLPVLASPGQVVMPARKKHRLTGKQGPGELNTNNSPGNLVDSYVRSKTYKNFRKLSVKYQRKFNKMVHVKKTRALGRFKVNSGVEMKAGVVINPNPKKTWIQQKDELTDKWLVEMIRNPGLHDDVKLAGAAMDIYVRRQQYAQTSVAAAVNNTVLAFSPTILLTWNGEWGLIDTGPLNLVVGQTCLNDVGRLCKNHPEARSLFEQITSCVQEWQQTVIEDYVVAVELCPGSYAKGVVRLHLHAWMKFRGRQPRGGRLVELSKFMVLGSKPVQSAWQHSRGARSEFAGAFYLSIEHKVGQVMSRGTVRPHIDYAVSPLWVMRMRSAGQIPAAVACSQFAQGVFAAKMNIDNIMAAEKWLLKSTLETQKMEVEKQLRANRSQFKVIPEVETWLQSFAVLRDRYKFLVLDGESGLGKTRFVANLVHAEAFLLLDCGNAVTPDLLDHRRGDHMLVLYDEAHAEMIIRYKKVFQSGIDFAKIAGSATNNQAYTVWMHGIKQVVASNKWEEQLAELPRGDRAWIVANSVYVKVTEPLWIQ